MIKPDGVQRRLVGRIVGRIEEKGLRIAGMKLVRMTAAQAADLYAQHRGKDFYDRLVRFVTSSPVVVMAVEGNRAAAVVRRMMGARSGFEAEPGTLRGDFGDSESWNLVHGADDPASGRREISIFFGEDELAACEHADQPWICTEFERA